MKKEQDLMQNLMNERHSLSHLLAAAVLEIYPDAKVTLGPPIDNGFYYDFQFTSAVSNDDLPKIQKKMLELLPKWTEFTSQEVSADEAREIFAGNEFKLELINDIEKSGEKITLYTCGGFTDLCKGGHIENLSSIDKKSFELNKVAGAYWRGDENNPMLTRIYGLAFETAQDLDAYKKQLEEAAARDHRKIGKELDLFVFSSVVGKGLPIWTEKGATMRRVLERFIVDEEINRGYKHVYTPDIANIDLYKKSGHYPYYKDSMYAPIKIDDDEYMLRPMTCPHHYELYLSKPRSYRELPMRIAELAKLYRYEQSGELSGLIRVRSFCLSDAHIICANPEQAQQEISSALDLIEFMAHKLGLEYKKDYSYRLSLGNRENEEKYYKDDAAWNTSEEILRQTLISRGSEFREAEDEAAFYGPKIDIQMKNVSGKEDTAFTVQYDFVMPKRFELEYTDSDGKIKEAIVIHRSSAGAIERVLAFLIERTAGNFPLWISPTQIEIITINESQFEYAQEVANRLKSEGFRVGFDKSDEGFGKKVRKAKTEKTPYFVIIGDAEVESKTLTLESRDAGKIGSISLEDLVVKLKEEN
ncbi:MAG: threonine--tRNA ligase [Candidatus Paceibacterota bacterium]